MPYFTDFESGAGPEWSLANVETSEQIIFSRFSGRFANQTQTVALTSLTIGQSYTVGFDLYILDSWDGNTAPGDYFNVSVDGFQLFHYTFANFAVAQSFPGVGDDHRVQLGFSSTYVDSIYRNVEVTFIASNTTANISFSGQNLLSIDDESWGIDNVSVKLTADLATTTIRSTTLPPNGSTNSVAVESFTISASRPLSAATANNAVNYNLREAGLSGNFDDGDDVTVAIAPAFTSGKTVSFTVANIPLQPGRYRFQSTTGLQWTNGAAVAAFSREFTLVHPALGKIENTSNNTLGTATPLPTTESPSATSFFTAFAVGAFGSTTDVDYWRFDAEAGDRLTVRLEAESTGVAPQLQLRNSSDGNVLNGTAGVEGVVGFQNFVIASPGTYYLRALSTSRRSRYQMRVDQSRGPQMESESNGTQGTANTIDFTFSPGIALGRIVGALPTDDATGDFFRLGTLNPGNVISANPVFPAGSSLLANQLAYSIFLEGNTNSLAETNSYTVVSNGIHYLRLSTTNRAIRSQYLLNFAISDGVAPTITGTTLPAQATTTTSIVDRFTLTFSEDMVSLSISNPANYDLRSSGGDGQFDTGDDAIYTVVSAGYTGGLNAPYTITDGPLQPGNYRFTARSNLIDRASNPMAAPFVLNFTVAGIAGFVLENRRNDLGALGTPLSLSPTTNADGTVSFLASIGAAAQPYFIAAGNFNADTNLDLVVARYNSDGISILLNAGNANFQVATNISTGNGAISVATADLNHDNALDLAVANYAANTLTVLLGNGAGAFQLASNYTGFSNPRNLAIADLNGDTHPDLAIPNAGNGTVSILWGIGNGAFGSRSNYTVGSSPYTVAIGNLNADANPDLAVANAGSGTLSILLGTGTTFQLTTNLPVGSGPRSVAIADLNTDGTNDLISLEANDNTVSILLGNGNGTFKPRSDYYSGTADAYNMTLADLNADGKRDIIIAGYGSSVFSILLNNGTAIFTNLATYTQSGSPIALAAGDYNGDSRIDLAFGNYNGNTVTLWLGNPTSPLAENPPATGLKTALARGNLSSPADVDYYQFTATAGDAALVAIDIPGHPANTSLTVALQDADGSNLATFNADASGWGQTAIVTLPYTGTYLVRVTANNDYQSEYRIRVSTLRAPAQFETELNNTTATADVPVFGLTAGHLQSTLVGYLSFGDGIDFYRLGNLTEGTTINLNIRQPSGSAFAPILEILNGSGTTIATSAPGATNLALTLGPTQAGLYYARIRPGEIGHAGGPGYTLQLDGNDDFLNITNFGTTLPTTEITVEFWQYTAAIKQQHTFILNPDNTANRFSAHIPYSDGIIYWDFGNINSQGRLSYTPPASILATWQHFALVSSQPGNYMRIYRNGVLEAQKTGASTFTQSAFTLQIGGPSGTRFGGALDDFRIWNVARTQGEIQANMNQTLIGNETGLVGYWKFNEGTGTNANDSTILAHHGTLVNGATWGVDGTLVAQPAGLLAQYLLDIDLSGTTPFAITSETLPAQGTSVSNLIDRFTVTFSQDADPAFNALNRVIRTYSGHNYMLTDTSGTWVDAENQAVALGGHLVTINNVAENDFIYQNFSTATPWIGLTDRTNEGTFTWINGEPLTYTAWNSGEPNNSGSEDFAQMLTSGLWNDLRTGNLRGVVEVTSTTDTDADGLVDTLDKYPNDPLNAFDLRAAGTDGQFDTPDDIIYDLDTTGYTDGLAASFNIVDGPLQAGNYRLKITPSFKDRLGNPLTTPYVKTFTVTGVTGFITENRNNNSSATATSFSLALTNAPDGSFTFVRSTPSGQNPYFILTAYFNGDTNLDLAVANYTSGNVSIFLGDGAANFQLSTNVPTGSGAISIAVGNFNGDANLDLAVANYAAGSMSVLLGNGAGGFQLASNYTGFVNPRNLATADFNGDGNLDLVVPNYGAANVSVLLGNGNGTFGPRVNYSSANNPFHVGVGDINGDGKADLAVANSFSESVSLLLGNGNGTFQTAVNLPMAVNSTPRSAALAQFNSDTNLDLIVLDAGLSTVSVFAGNGDGTFAPRVAYPIGSSDSYQLVLADLDADNDLDVAVAGYSGNRLVTLLNNGDGTLGGGVQYSVGSNPISVTVGDFNQDGRADIATANYNSHNFSIVLGNGSQPIAEDAAGTGLRISAARGNLSSNADVDYWSFSGSTGDRLFVASETPGNLPSSGLCYTIYRPDGQNLASFCSDPNGHGDLGVVLPVSGTYSIGVTYNYTYSGEYRLRLTLARPPVQYEVEGNDTIAAADAVTLAFSTGHQTATVLGYIDTTVDYFRLGNLAQGTTINLGLRQPATSSAFPFVIGIYNAAGALVTNAAAGVTNLSFAVGAGGDGAYYSRVSLSGSGGIFAQYLLDIDLADTLPPSITATSWPSEGAVVSNILDRFTLNFSEDLTVPTVTNPAHYELRGAGADTTFGTPDDELYPIVNSPAYSSGLSASYLVNNGPLQPGLYRFIVRTNLTDRAGNYLASQFVRNFQVVNVPGFVFESRNNNSQALATSLSLNPNAAPDGSLAGPSNAIGIGSNPYYLAAGYLNNDTNLDIVVANFSSGSISVLLGNGDGTFQLRTNHSTGSGAISPVLGDFNGDSKLDVAVANYNANTVTVLLGNGDGTFQISSNYNVGAQPYSIVAGNFDVDGDLDLAVANYTGDSVSVLLGNGNGTFAGAVNYPAGDGALSIAAADVNEDGKIDLVTANYNSDNLSLFLGNGNGTFASAVGMAVNGTPRSVAIGDLNGDGNLDLVSANTADNTVSILLGNGDGSFQPRINLASGANNSYQVILADMNGDGRPDLVLGGYSGSHISVLLNRGGASFEAPAVYPGFSNPIGVAAGDFNSDGRMDLAAANYSANNVMILTGDNTEFLADDGLGFRLGTGRGNLFNTSDADYWSFSVRAGDRIVVASETPGGAGSSGLCYTLYRPDGVNLASFCADSNGRGEVGSVASVSGTYAVGVTYNYSYSGEYRMRVTLAPAPLQIEAENNGSVGAANSPSFTLGAGHRTASVLGYLDGGDAAGDYFRLGTLAGGATINVNFARPNSSGLIAILGIYNSAGTLQTNAPAGTTNLSFNVPAGPGDTYFARISASGGSGGLFAQYLLNLDISDAVAPSITLVTLPGGGTTNLGIIDRLTLNFSKELDPAFNALNRFILNYNGHAYTVSDPNLKWYDAERQALALGGHLATINDAAENNWIRDNFGGFGTLWIGLTDESQEGLFAWVSGEPVTYFNWNSGEPNNSGNEDYATILASGLWNDAGVNATERGLIETSGTDTDGDGRPDGLDAYPADPFNGIDLRSAGPDTLFDTPDDEVYRLTWNTYASGVTLDLSIADGPLQPGSYRFRVTSALRDRFGNPMTPFDQFFTIGIVPAYIVENRNNNSPANATPLPLVEDPAGLRTAGGRGNLTSTSDSDYWSFTALAGDKLILATEVPGNPGSSQLYYRVFHNNGSQLFDFYPENTGGGQAPVATIPTNGTYRILVTYNSAYFGEYRLRVALAGAPLQAENEDNGALGAATPMTLAVSGDTRFGSVSGIARTAADLDYFNLGTLTNGSSVFLNVRLPAASSLIPVVSLYNAANVYQAEAGGGRPDDGVAEVRITQTGTYYALVRGGQGTGGLREHYALDVQLVPTGTVSFPNLQVTAIALPTGGGIQSGQQITYAFSVTNVGSLATPGGNWSDRVALSLNTTLGDADDVPLGFLPHSGALNPGQGYTVTPAVTLPECISGSYYIIVQTDAGNAINEFVFEADNITISSATFPINLAPYPDLRIEDLSLVGPDSNSVYTVTWNTANRGTAPAPGGFKERFVVRNLTTAAVLVNTEQTVGTTLGVNATLAQLRTFAVSNAGNYRVEVTTDSQNQLFECAAAEQNTSVTNFQIIQLFTVSLQSSPPGAGILTGAGTFSSGSFVTVTAQPNTNALPYQFVNWTETGTFQSANTNYTFVLARNRSLTANFTLPAYQIAASNNPPAGGTVSGQGTFFHGTTNLLTATANLGYRFTNWTENSVVIQSSNVLATMVTSNRFVVANYVELNIFHVVTTATFPTNVATVSGAGTYTNGQAGQFSVPAVVTNPPTLYTFRRYKLNGAIISTNAAFEKTFTTADPTNIALVAEFDARNLTPLIVDAFGSVTNPLIAGFSVVTNPIPATTNYQLALRFDRTMNGGIEPFIRISNSAPGSVQPNVPSGGTWTTTLIANDTYRTPPIVFGAGTQGTNRVFVSAAADLSGAILDETNALAVIVDLTPPAQPTLSLVASNSSSVTVDWSAYAAPADVNGFRVYRQTQNFNTLDGLTSLARLGPGVRTYQYAGLQLDTNYYLVVAAVDHAGNSAEPVTPFVVRLPSSLPPPANVTVQAVGATSAQILWQGYNTANLFGFAGFRLYYEESNFSSVAALTPKLTLSTGARSAQVDNLDRTKTYYFAVVGFNGTNGFNPNVTTARWTDPYAGTIGANTTLGGAGQVLDIYQSITVVSNAILTVQPGTTLRFAPGTGLTVQQGRLTANGTALDPIYFTSSQASPAAGAWNGITLLSNAANSVLRHVFIDYGAGLTLDSCQPTVEALSARFNLPSGANLKNGARLTTRDALVLFNGIGVQQSDTAQLNVAGSVIKNNGTNALASGSQSLIATQNWWGTAVTGDIDASLQGNVNRGNFLAFEPLLTPAIGLSNNITQTGSRDVIVKLACRTAETMRLSEDSSFFAVFFQPFATFAPFQISDGGGQKIIFAQFRSITGQNSDPVSVNVNYITAGPTISSFNLTEGQLLSRPINVTGQASASLGMDRIEFYVDSILQSSNVGGIFNYRLDVRAFEAGVHRVKLLARDNSGNFSTLERNVFVNVASPPAPNITVPATDITVTVNGLQVSGTAEPLLEVRLAREGVILGVTNASAAGTFNFANVLLQEGLNRLIAVGVDAIGSASSPVRNVVLDSGAPVAVIMDPPAYDAFGALDLSWHYASTGERATRFQLFWHTAPFTTTNQATGRNIVSPQLSARVQGLANGLYYFGVVGFDDAGNASPVSGLVNFDYDATPPSFAIAFDKSSPVGLGPVRITLTANESLNAIPSLTIRPQGAGSPILLNLSNVALNTFRVDFPVTSITPSGTADFRVSGSDLSSNVFNGIPAGPALLIDVTPPAGRIVTNPSGLVQTTNNVDVAVNLTLSEVVKPGTTPTLSFTPPSGSAVPVTLTGNGSNWNGVVTLTAPMGSGFGRFAMSARDAVDNIGTNILSGAVLELYNTPVPQAPPAPANLQALTLAGGGIRLSWNSVSNAESYRLYCEPGTNNAVPTVLVADELVATIVTNVPPSDGAYRYVVTGVRRGAEGTNSNLVIAQSDRTPPPAPTNVVVQLSSRGVQITWGQPNGSTPTLWHIYRNGTLIRTASAIAPVVDVPPRGLMNYTVGAADAAGNETLSAAASIALLVGAVENLLVLADDGVAPALSWTSSDPTAVGFDVYRNGIKQNASLLTGTNYVDLLPFDGQLAQYSIRAVNAAADQSASRAVDVYDVKLAAVANPSAAGTDRSLVTRYFDDFQVSVSNFTASAGLPIASLEVRRTQLGAATTTRTLAINNTVGANSFLRRDVVVPSAPSTDLETLRVRVFQQTDVGGSTVIYQKQLTFSDVVLQGTMVSVTANQLPLAGGLASFEVRLFNRGPVDMDVIVARENGGQPGDVAIAVKNVAGQEVARTAFMGAPPGTLFLSDGRARIRIGAGNSLAFTVPNVLVPEALGSQGSAIFEAVVNKVYYHLGAPEQEESGPLNGSTLSTLTQTPYYGTAQTDRAGYANEDPIIITGQALDRLTGQPVPNVPLKIGFAARGFRWERQVTTDSNGNYTYQYQTSVGFSGNLTLWAAHPLVFDALNQAQVIIYKLYAKPARGDIRMSKNDTLLFSIDLFNPGDTPLTNFSLQFAAYHLQGTNRIADPTLAGTADFETNYSVGPGQTRRINLALTAADQAPDFAIVEFTLRSTEGAAATFIGSVTLLPPVPILTVIEPRVGYVEVGLDRGRQISQLVRFVNRGRRELKGVELIPPTNITWMSVNLPVSQDGRIHLPDIGVGETNSFLVVFTPPIDTPLDYYQDQIIIRGTNALADFHVNVYARITSDLRGSVTFFVDNNLGLAVPEARVRVKNNLLQTEVGPLLTDTNGLVTFADLQEGLWQWQIGAAGHNTVVGTVQILPGQVAMVGAPTTRLSKSLVTINFSVVPVPFTDQYEIKIEQTFQTHVPVGVLVVDPPFKDFKNVTSGFEAQFIATARNHGLIEMTDLTITGAEVSGGRLVPLIEYFPVLLPEQTVEIPFVFTYNDPAQTQQASQTRQAPSGDDIAGCIVGALPFGGALSADVMRGMAALLAARERCISDLNPQSAFATIAILYGLANIYSAFLGPPFIAGTLAQIIGCLIGWFIPPNLFPDIDENGPSSGSSYGGTLACFAPATKVWMADGTHQAIETVHVDDWVRTGPSPGDLARVADVYQRRAPAIREITFEEPNLNLTPTRNLNLGPALPHVLHATEGHLIWVDGKGWTGASRLHEGDWVFTEDGKRARIRSNIRLATETTVHTLRLNGNNAFYAGGILVHEMCAEPFHEVAHE